MTRVGASQVFFNVVAGFNARKLIQDHNTTMNVMKAVTLDSFEAMLKPIEDVSRAIGVYIGSIKEISMEMGKASVEFNKFYDGADAAELEEELKGVGLAYAKVGTEALAAGSRAAQVAAIVGEENIPLLVEQAEILSNISDLTSEEAMKGIIKLQQQTGVLYGDLNTKQFQRLSQLEKEAVLTKNSAMALDALNTIANRSVAVEGELVETMTNFAAQGALVGESFQDMAAMSAVLLEAGEEAGAAGRALRMVYARMGGDIGGARTELEAMGVEVINSKGEMNTLTNVVQQLTDMGWDKMSSAMKQNIAQTIAGNRHYVRFIKLMENQERAVQLSSDALNDVDSAAEQAREAMRNFAYELESAEAAGENLKASLGESMSPFLLGVQGAKNDFLEMQVVVADTFGEGFAEAMGRMIGFTQVLGGFVKFGLGMQSLAIGMSMFDSVQRDLHGILIANETLHSKQATLFDFNIQATKEERVLLDAITYLHQLTNRYIERKNDLSLQINILNRENKGTMEEQVRLEEYANSITEQIVGNEQELHQLRQMNNMMLRDTGLSLGRIERIQVRSNQLNNDALRLEQQYQYIFNTKTAAQEAYNRMVIIAHTNTNKMSNKQIADVERMNNKLKQQSINIQSLLDEERLLSATRDATYGGQRAQIDFGNDQMRAAKATLEVLTAAYEDSSAKLMKLEETKANLAEGEELSGKQAEQLAYLEHEGRMYEALDTELKELISGKKENLELDKQTRAALMRLGEETVGHQMETDTLLKTVDLHGRALFRQSALQTANTMLTKEAKTTKGQLLDVLEQLGPVTDEIEELTKQLNEADKNHILTLKDKNKIQEVILSGQAAQSAEVEKYGSVLETNLSKAQIKAGDSTRKLTFALSAAAVPLMSMFKGVNAATAATVTMSMTLLPALSQISKATKEFIATQKALIAANAAAGKSFMGYVATLGKSLGPIIAITSALAYFNNQQAETAEALRVAEGFAAEHNEILVELKTNTHLFSDENEYLAEKLGITNYTLKELRKDGDLLEDTIGKLEDGFEGMDGSQENAIDSALRLADALLAIANGSAALNDEMIDVSYATIDEAYEGLSEIGNTLDETSLRLGLDYGGDRIRAGDELVEAGLFSDDAIEKHYAKAFGYKYQIGIDVDFEQLFSELQKMHEAGERLSKDEIKALGALIDDAEIYGAIVAINNSILTDTSEAGIFGNDGADQAQENIQTIGRDLQNLTEDVYDFGNAREELFFGGKYGNVTGSLYKQVVKQGVGVLYNKMDIVMSNNFHGFFNEREAADRIIAVLNEVAPSLNANS